MRGPGSGLLPCNRARWTATRLAGWREWLLSHPRRVARQGV